MTDSREPMLSFIPAELLALIPADVQQSIIDRMSTSQGEPTVLGFPFPVPAEANHIPLVQHAGPDYVCTGCGEHVPDGLRIYEKVIDGMVVGLRMTAGASDAGPLVHRCGRTD
jgi:hypothetical protein